MNSYQLNPFMIEFELEMMKAALDNVWHQNTKNYVFPQFKKLEAARQNSNKLRKVDQPKSGSLKSVSVNSNTQKSSYHSQLSNSQPQSIMKKSLFYNSYQHMRIPQAYEVRNKQNSDRSLRTNRNDPTISFKQSSNRQIFVNIKAN